MNALQRLHDLGQSVWLDNIRRELLTSGTLAKWIGELGGHRADLEPDDLRARHQPRHRLRRRYPAPMPPRAARPREVFFAIALEDITAAADLFRRCPRSQRRRSMASSRSKCRHASPTMPRAPSRRRSACTRPPRVRTCFIKVPGTAAGPAAIEELIFAGVPINVTLLFSREHYLGAAYAYLKGLERRVAAGRKPDVASVASLFVSRWDVATAQLPDGLRDQLGIAICKRAYKAYRELARLGALASVWQRQGRAPQRLLWASTGTKSKTLPDTYYIGALAAPQTVNTMPEATLARVRRSRQRAAASWRPTAATPKRCCDASAPPVSTSTRSASSCRSRGAMPSSRRSTNCSNASAPRCRRCARREIGERRGAPAAVWTGHAMSGGAVQRQRRRR